MMQISRLRLQVASVRRGRPSPAPAEVCDECLATSESLLQELAAFEMRCEALTRHANMQRIQMDALVQRLPIACVEVTENGIIVAANQEAAAILNTSPKYLETRLLLHFAEDREHFAALLRALPTDDTQCRASLRVRPRERAVVPIDATIMRRTCGDERERSWLWFLTTSSRMPTASARISYPMSEQADSCTSA